MNKISFCPFCGAEFKATSDSSPSRSASGYKCNDCNEMLEIKVNQFPLA